MTTMSDDGDRTCPLCAEEMDITDQQLKPCKCGYDICVWCWHHIIDMAEKDETEGRCPACRTPYDKERIVNMAATCDRTLVEKNAEKKQKTQKAKPKVAATATLTAEAKRHLASVRVIQRNLVYIIGLPTHLCNESVLERREYFGQYGKVLKVSVSRPNGPPPQQASGNNNISVYITYAKEEEAVRCIQAVHNFVLEGKVLRACFGTTKYCHAWLRNMTCGNPDCLYLHDVGSQEDSFTKDEVISAYTRTRVPQMASSVSQRRAGTVLPPPTDDFSYSAVVSAKHTVKNGTLNTTNQPRLSPPDSSSGRPTLPPAASWGHRDLTAKATGTGVTPPSQSLTKSKPEPQSHLVSSSTVSSARIPSSWNDDTSSASKISEERHLLGKDSSKSIEPYKPGIAKETQALSSSLNSSLDIDFSTIPSAWNDDDIPGSDEISKGGEENQVVNGNGKLSHPGSKSPKRDRTLSSTSKGSLDLISSSTSKSDVNIADGDNLVTDISPKSPLSKDVNCHLAGGKKILEDTGHNETDIEKLSVCISSVMLDAIDRVHSMAGNQLPDAMPHTSVAELLPSENKSTSDKHLGWSSELQSCSGTPLVDSLLNTDKYHMTLLDGTGVPSYSSFINLSDTSNTSLWDDTKSTTSMMQTKQSSTDNTYGLLDRVQDGLATVYTSGSVSVHPGMDSHRPGAISVQPDSTENSDKTISINKDENKIISDVLLSEFNPWDASYSTANDFVRMLRESENNDAPFSMPSWKSGTGSKESRFAFARQDNQGSMSDSSLRNCISENNFNLLSHNSCGNVYQNGLRFHSQENSLGTSRSKIPAPPGFSAPARVPPPGFSSHDGLNPPPGFSSGFPSQDGLNPPGFSSGFPSQDGLDPPPGFSSGIPPHDGSNPTSRFPSAFSSRISLQNGSNPPPRFPSAFSSGFPSQDGLGSSSRFMSAFSSGFSSQDGPNSPSRFHPSFSPGFSSQDGSNPPSRFSSAFSSGFSSQDGLNQIYGSTFSETRIRDNLLGGNSNHHEPQLARHTSDLEFVDPAILAVGKGRMPGIGDLGLEMRNTTAFPVQMQTSNSDQKIQLLMQQNLQSHERTQIQDAFNIMTDNYLASRLLGQNQGSLSPYAQMPPQQPRSSHLTNGHWDGWSDLRHGNSTPMPDMSGVLHPNEAHNLHMMGSNDVYSRAFGM